MLSARVLALLAVAGAALVGQAPRVHALSAPKVGAKGFHIPKEMRQKMQDTTELRSVKQFVESTKNVGFFQHTDKTFAPYLANHERFFALFYAPFSDVCNEFLEGYHQAADSLVAQGFAANFSAIDCMAHPLLCSYHGLSRFPPPVVLFFDRTRERDGEGDKAFRKISLPPRVRAKQFMRGLFLNIVGEVTDPYEEWEQWETNGAIVHVNPISVENWEKRYGAALVVLFGASVTQQQQAEIAVASLALAKSGVETVAINCEHHDETCVSTFSPHSFPAIYFKKGEHFWKGYRGAVEAASIVAWSGVVSGVSKPSDSADPAHSEL